jgi:cytochrome b subunit of formate dehydrogenase
MSPTTIRGIIKTSIVTAFTITAALIWKEVFSETIHLFFPQSTLFYEFLGAVIITIFVIIAIYITLKTEHEAGVILEGIKRMNKNKRKQIIKEIEKNRKKNIK